MEDIYYYDADDQAEYDMMRKDEETHMLYQYSTDLVIKSDYKLIEGYKRYSGF